MLLPSDLLAPQQLLAQGHLSGGKWWRGKHCLSLSPTTFILLVCGSEMASLQSQAHFSNLQATTAPQHATAYWTTGSIQTLQISLEHQLICFLAPEQTQACTSNNIYTEKSKERRQMFGWDRRWGSVKDLIADKSDLKVRKLWRFSEKPIWFLPFISLRRHRSDVISRTYQTMF